MDFEWYYDCQVYLPSRYLNNIPVQETGCNTEEKEQEQQQQSRPPKTKHFLIQLKASDHHVSFHNRSTKPTNQSNSYNNNNNNNNKNNNNTWQNNDDGNNKNNSNISTSYVQSLPLVV